MLLNDSLVMVTERDEFVYHEMIAHVPAFVHPGVRRALVIGGGDGGTVRELLRHPTVEHVDLVEIDPLVIEGCREHLRSMSSAFDDPRCRVTVADGVAFVKEAAADSYDLVIVDSTDPIGPATPLFGDRFYADVHRLLRADGIVVSQAETPFYEAERQQSMARILKGRFERVQIYNYVNMTYPGALWSFTFASKADRCPVGDFDRRRVEAVDWDLQYYDADVHVAAFVHPVFQKRLLDGLLTPLKPRT